MLMNEMIQTQVPSKALTMLKAHLSSAKLTSGREFNKPRTYETYTKSAMDMTNRAFSALLDEASWKTELNREIRRTEADALRLDEAASIACDKVRQAVTWRLRGGYVDEAARIACDKARPRSHRPALSAAVPHGPPMTHSSPHPHTLVAGALAQTSISPPPPAAPTTAAGASRRARGAGAGREGAAPRGGRFLSSCGARLP